MTPASGCSFIHSSEELPFLSSQPLFSSFVTSFLLFCLGHEGHPGKGDPEDSGGVVQKALHGYRFTLLLVIWEAPTNQQDWLHVHVTGCVPSTDVLAALISRRLEAG